LKIKPKISIIAAGLNPDDLGRNEKADESIFNSEKLINHFKGSQFDNIDISTDGILIEQSISRGSNIIINTDGITGNLIYRTLVNCSAEWKSFGAFLVSNNTLLKNKIIIDTSHKGSLHDYRRALTFASALANVNL